MNCKWHIFKGSAAVLLALAVSVPDSLGGSVPPSDSATVGEVLMRYQIVPTTGPMISGVTDAGNHCDDCVTPLALPFPFTLYGQTFTTARVNSNGALEFGSSSSDFFNVCLPAAAYTYSIIPHWDDLRTDQPNGGVFTATYGEAPHRVFVVEWRASNFFDSASVANFAVVLYESRPAFEVIYGEVSGMGESATVGVQQDLTNYTQYSCNEIVLGPGLRLLFGGAGCVSADDSTSIPLNSGTTAIDVLANDADLNGYGLRVATVTPAANGFVGITADGSSVTYAPVAEFVGSDSFTYTVTNVFGVSATATINVEVVNHNPTARDDGASTTEDVSVTVSVLANDDFAPDFAETLTVVSAVGAAHGSLAYAPTSVTYTPAANYSGPDSFTYTIIDGHGGSATAQVNVTVLPANDNPLAVGDAATVDQGASVTVDVLANDTSSPDVGESLSVVAVSQGANGLVQFSAASVVYTPAASFQGVDSFTYTISDGNGGLATATVTITVRKVNTAPRVVMASPASLQLKEGDQLTISGTIIDPDSMDTHTVVVDWGDGSPLTTITLPTGLRNFSASHVFLDNPPAGSSFAPIVVTVSDSHGEQDVATLRFTVHNALPVIASASLTPNVVLVGSAVEALVQFSDAGIFDTHVVRFVWGDGTPDTTIDSGGYSRAASHSFNVPGVYSVTVVVTDKDGGSASSVAGHVTVIDPFAGYLTGGGWLKIGPGVWSANPALTGKASFDSNLRYEAADALRGKVSLSLPGFEFVSTALDWLVIDGVAAQAQGAGTVNGTGAFTFRAFAAETSRGDVFRLQVWNAATGEFVFDTAGLQNEANACTNLIGGGNIKVHTTKVQTGAAKRTKSAQASPSKLAR